MLGLVLQVKSSTILFYFPDELKKEGGKFSMRKYELKYWHLGFLFKYQSPGEWLGVIWEPFLRIGIILNDVLFVCSPAADIPT